MLQELSEIKLLRKQLGLTQHDLAKRAMVSQSLIAKIEAGRIDPTYTKARRIFETLNNISKVSKTKAYEIMNKKIVIASPKESIKQVITEMKKHGISQLPVLESCNIVGLVSDTMILNALLEGKHKSVEDIMSDAPPTVNKDTDIDVISDLLMHFPIVAVVDKGKLVGIIAKFDILERLRK